MSGTKSTAPETLEERPRIYVASKSDLHGYWRTWRATGQSDGFEVISTWIDEGDEGETADWSDLWVRCVTEAATADAVVALYRPGDVWKGALVEIGAALAAGKPVHLIGEPNHSWVAHPLVRQFETVDDAFAALLPPAPEPIKVGDPVECAHPGDFLALERPVVDGFTQDGTHVIVGNPDEGYYPYRLDFVRRVDSSPSPEPEPHGIGLDGRCDECDGPAPSPSPEVGEGVEPHESEDPEELAAAVAAGLRVNPRPPGEDWRDRQTYDGTVSAFREALDYGFRYRIHGTVPGYGETGGAS